RDRAGRQDSRRQVDHQPGREAQCEPGERLMLEFPRWKVWLVSLVVAMGVLLSIPSLIAGTPAAASWPKWLPHYKINLGLDLAGGSHLLLEADAQDALKTRLQAKEDEVATELRR